MAAGKRSGSAVGRRRFFPAIPAKSGFVTRGPKKSHIFRNGCLFDLLASRSLSTACNRTQGQPQRKLKFRERPVIFFRAPLGAVKRMLRSILFSPGKHAKRLPAFCGKRPSFSPPPPLSDPRHAQRCGERTSRVCAYTRTPQSVFVFCLHPSRRGRSGLIARALEVKMLPFFRPSPPLPTCAAMVKDEKQKPSPLTH